MLREEREASQQLLSEVPGIIAAAPRRSTRTTAGKAPLQLSDDLRYTSEETHLTVVQALASPQAQQWQQTMHRELTLLEKYGIFE